MQKELEEAYAKRLGGREHAERALISVTPQAPINAGSMALQQGQENYPPVDLDPSLTGIRTAPSSTPTSLAPTLSLSDFYSSPDLGSDDALGSNGSGIDCSMTWTDQTNSIAMPHGPGSSAPSLTLPNPSDGSDGSDGSGLSLITQTSYKELFANSGDDPGWGLPSTHGSLDILDDFMRSTADTRSPGSNGTERVTGSEPTQFIFPPPLAEIPSPSTRAADGVHVTTTGDSSGEDGVRRAERVGCSGAGAGVTSGDGGGGIERSRDQERMVDGGGNGEAAADREGEACAGGDGHANANDDDLTHVGCDSHAGPGDDYQADAAGTSDIVTSHDDINHASTNDEGRAGIDHTGGAGGEGGIDVDHEGCAGEVAQKAVKNGTRSTRATKKKAKPGPRPKPRPVGTSRRAEPREVLQTSEDLNTRTRPSRSLKRVERPDEAWEKEEQQKKKVRIEKKGRKAKENMA